MITDWRHDPLQAFAAGRELSALGSSSTRHALGHDPILALWIEMVFVSICHSTNWDRLHDRIVEIASVDPRTVSPPSLQGLGEEDARAFFAGALECDSSIRERAAILRELADYACETDLFSTIGRWTVSGVTLEGECGLYRILDEIPAYAADPLRKKSRVLAHQVSRFQLATILDPGALAPAIDYHLIRLYMRTNRIYPRDKRGYEVFSDTRSLGDEGILRMRLAVEEALRYTSEGADLCIAEVNDLEWQIARSFCVRDRPRCNEGPLPTKPVSEALEAASKTAGGCPLRNVCLGRHLPRVQRLQEPKSTSSFY